MLNHTISPPGNGKGICTLYAPSLSGCRFRTRVCGSSTRVSLCLLLDPDTKDCTKDRTEISCHAHYLEMAVIGAALKGLKRTDSKTDLLFQTYLERSPKPGFKGTLEDTI